MARQRPKAKADFVLFDVLYEDGTLTSNRKVPSSMPGGLEGDDTGKQSLCESNLIAACAPMFCYRILRQDALRGTGSYR